MRELVVKLLIVERNSAVLSYPRLGKAINGIICGPQKKA